ncbi:hypothetical protein ACOSQ2_003303 [Xanthoceras sorbifolium]
MLSSIKRVEGCCSPEVAEARAILHGIKLASEVGILPPIVESDSSIMIFLDLQHSFGFINFVFSQRNTNKVAHSLAKIALVHDVDLVLMEEVSPSLNRLVQEDASFS